MLKDIEKKKKIIAMRLSLLEEMKKQLLAYKTLGDDGCLEYAKQLGRDSEKLKKVLEKMK